MDKSERRPSKSQAMAIDVCLVLWGRTWGRRSPSGFSIWCWHQCMSHDHWVAGHSASCSNWRRRSNCKGNEVHLKCLVKLRNRCRSLSRKSNQEQNTGEKLNESRASVELTSYIKKAVDSATLLFKLSEIHSLYVNRLEDLGIKEASQQNQTEG